jgi:hypothetical protein
MDEHSNSQAKGKPAPEPLVRKARWERKIRHQARVEKLKELPKVKEGRLLEDVEDDLDERSWLDW